MVAAILGRDRRWRRGRCGDGHRRRSLPLLNPWGLALYAFVDQTLTSQVTGSLVQE